MPFNNIPPPYKSSNRNQQYRPDNPSGSKGYLPQPECNRNRSWNQPRHPRFQSPVYRDGQVHRDNNFSNPNRIQSNNTDFGANKIVNDTDTKPSTSNRSIQNPFRDDSDYFDKIEDDTDDKQDEPESSEKHEESIAKVDDDEEDDPLDAYMKSLESQSPVDQVTSQRVDKSSEQEDVDIIQVSGIAQPQVIKSASNTNKRGLRLDIESNDDTEDVYLSKCKQITSDDADLNDDETSDMNHDVEYDDDDNIVSVKRVKREIEPLPSIDHNTIEYSPFERNFYKEHPEIEKLTTEEELSLRAKLELKVSGQSPPKPVCSFAHFNFDEQLMRVIRRSEYTQPTPIQAQAIPTALLGRNLIGVALTGSGKTAAYLWPMIAHIMGQPDLKQGEGPIGLVLVPTRELALQVYGQARKFSNSYNIAVVCAYGGGSKYEQTRDLEAGAEIVVATPGRLIDLIKLKATNLRRVTYLVLDEADRFFDFGFEVQVKSICDHIRPDRQTLLFSATFKHKTEQLARRIVDDPIKIVQKTPGECNEDVRQHVITLNDVGKKWDWLLDKLVEFTSNGSVLIFVTRITNSEELHKNLQELGKDTLLLHGDMEQVERNRVISSFKRKEKDILIATDVAARGLDISHIRTVINYDVARDIDTHVHRIGRTGRAGSKGDAYTLITDKERDFAGHLVKNLEASNQTVQDGLMKIAMQSYTFRKTRKTGNNNHNHNNNNNNRQNPGNSRFEDRSGRSTGDSRRYDQHNHHQYQHHVDYSGYQSHQGPAMSSNRNYEHQHSPAHRFPHNSARTTVSGHDNLPSRGFNQEFQYRKRTKFN